MKYNLVIVYPKRLTVPDGDACMRCPRTLGRGGRYVHIDGITKALCSGCVAAVCKQAHHVHRERH